MKKTIFFLALFAASFQAYPQCTPDNSLQLVGFYPPDSLLPCVTSGVYYDEVIQFKNFSVIPGDAVGFPGQVFTVNWVRIDSIRSMPSGLTYTCNSPNCYYTTGEVGCVRVTGTTNAPPGDYYLGFFATVQIDLGGFPFTAQADSQLLASNGLSYKLTVIAPTTSCPNTLPSPIVCTPDTTLLQVGFYPADSLLPCVESGTYYDEVIQFKNFDVVDGAAVGFPGFLLNIVSVTLDSVRNTPDGLTYACNNPTCTFLNSESGCVRMSGYTNAPPGVYNLGFFATVVVDISGTQFTIQADSQLLANAGLGYRLTVISPGTQCPNTFTPGPLSVTARRPPVVCQGDTVPLAATINGGASPYSFLWSPGGVLSNPSIPNPLLYPANPGTYSVTVTDNNGATATDDISVQYNPLPAVFVSGDVVVCPGEPAQLSASGGISYQWVPGTGLSASNVPNPLAAPASTTTYTVRVSDGICSNTGTLTVTVDTSSPVAGFTFIKNNFTVAFVSNSVNAVSFAWDFDDGSSSTQENPVKQFPVPGVYDVTLIVTDACGNTASFSAAVDMTTGISDKNIIDFADVFPNPGNGVFQIKSRLQHTGALTLSVMSVRGEEIQKITLPGNEQQTTLDLTGLSKGVYYLRITQEQITMVKKLVIH